MQYDSLLWGPGSRSKACNSKCPRGWVTLTKNSHIAGQKTGCKSGRYAPLCARDVIRKESLGTCYSTFISQLLSGGYSQRIDIEGQYGFHFTGETNTPASRTTERNAERGISPRNDCRGTLPIGDLSINVPARFQLKTSEDLFTRRTTGSAQFPDKKHDKPFLMSDPSATPEHTGPMEYDTTYKSCDEVVHSEPCVHHDFVMADGRSFGLNTCPSVETKIGLLPLLGMCRASHMVTTS